MNGCDCELRSGGQSCLCVFIYLHGDQLGNGNKFEPTFEESIDGGGHGIDSLGMQVMCEDDSAGIRGGEYALCDYGGAGALPIERIDGPEDGGVAELLVDHTALALEEASVGRTHGARADAGCFADGVLAALHFLADFGVV